LPTIICVMLMSIAFFFLFLLYATFCDSIFYCLISCNVIVTHNKKAVGLVGRNILNVKGKP